MNKAPSDKNKNSVVIIGGSGFIGTHLSNYLLEKNLVEKVYCIDIMKPKFHDSSHYKYFYHDIRKPIDIEIADVKIIYNLAAIHRTPGHFNEEYFTTNILGAKNTCEFAERKNINTIVFTSSIAPYGPSEELKTEDDIPQPATAYGSSKLVAEYIHQVWLALAPNRKLVVLRPGVVFGYGENGNFSRLYKGMKNKYFFYPGRKDTKKACIYIKDFVRIIYEMAKNNEKFQIYNMCYSEAPSIEMIAKTTSAVVKIPECKLTIPGNLLKTAAKILRLLFRTIGKETAIHPDRVEKLMLSTNISGEKLANSPYSIKYSLQEAIKDWYEDCNKKGLF